ncbi:energy-coupling factor transporter transmembrane component T family protein [Bombiscardovia coagulans]|uniref:ABC transporter permease n=1 Tax=Bombiscardovia coagulans TaxID=686666 RepID=A0A261ETW3_9BIFI|nr:energy-coupling factor transporter transmembrane component T [Bombiscardovia coagulans]OZG50265.1 ABC transporter permease [Bombiscardovia coagulans]
MKQASIFTTFFLIILANVSLFFSMPVWLQAALCCFLCAPLFLTRKYKKGLKWLLISAIFVVGNACVLLYPDNFWGHYLLFLFSGFGKLLPVVIVAVVVFSTTRVSELVYGLRCLHVPQWIIIPLSVLFRFFPTIRYDYRQIREAMKFRGLAVSGASMLLHPFRSMELIYVPLLNNASNVAADLTAAALTRGISDPGTKSSLTEVSIGVVDIGMVVVGLGLLGCLVYA